MKKKLLFVALFWIIILSSLVLSKEITLRSGKEVLLKTVPVDPRDFFRGDYVTLSYGINRMDLKVIPNDKTEYFSGKQIYVILKKDGRYYIPKRITSTKPSTKAPFIRGKVKYYSPYEKAINVNYGIESYFVPEGKGKILERARGSSLEVKASVDKSGNAVIKDLLLRGKKVNLKEITEDDENDEDW